MTEPNIKYANISQQQITNCCVHCAVWTVQHLSGVDHGEEGAEVRVPEAGARHHGHQVAGVRGEQGAQERAV